MELHVSLCAAVPERALGRIHPAARRRHTSAWRCATATPYRRRAPGLGIDWDVAAIDRHAVARATIVA